MAFASSEATITFLLALLDSTPSKPDYEAVATKTGMYKGGKYVYQALSSLRKKHAAGTLIASNAGGGVASKARIAAGTKVTATSNVNGDDGDDDDNDPAYGEKPKKRGRGPGKKRKAAVKVKKEDDSDKNDDDGDVKLEQRDDDEDVEQPTPKRSRKDPTTPIAKWSGRQAQVATPQPTPADEKAMEEVERAFSGGQEHPNGFGDTMPFTQGPWPVSYKTAEEMGGMETAADEYGNVINNDDDDVQKQIAMEVAMMNGAQLVGEDDLSMFDESWVA